MDMMGIINEAARNNPMISNLVRLLQAGNSSDVETFARNVFREKGRDFDKEYNDFRSKDS